MLLARCQEDAGWPTALDFGGTSSVAQSAVPLLGDARCHHALIWRTMTGARQHGQRLTAPPVGRSCWTEQGCNAAQHLATCIHAWALHSREELLAPPLLPGDAQERLDGPRFQLSAGPGVLRKGRVPMLDNACCMM